MKKRIGYYLVAFLNVVAALALIYYSGLFIGLFRSEKEFLADKIVREGRQILTEETKASTEYTRFLGL